MTAQQLVHQLHQKPLSYLGHARLFWRRLVALLLFYVPARRREEEEDVVEVELAPRRRRVERGEVHEVGEFYFRDTILNQLERYFLILRRMRRADPDAYTFYRQLGASILPERAERTLGWGDEAEKTPSQWFLKIRPSFGMVMYGTRSGDHRLDEAETKRNPTLRTGTRFWLPFAIYFTKYHDKHAPPTIQPVNQGDIYKVTVYWDSLSLSWMKTGSPTEYAVVVMPDGGMGLLKILNDHGTSVRAKHGRDRGSTFHVPHRCWDIPAFFKDWAKQHDLSVDAYLISLFIDAVNAHAAASLGMVRVRVAKGNIVARFNVNVLRTPYFFRDRGVRVGNKRRPIFHIVRTHHRQGARRPVRTHFRGERRFAWHGYKVDIAVPGWHHLNIDEIDIGAMDEDTVDPKIPMLGMEAVASRLLKAETDGVGGVRRA